MGSRGYWLVMTVPLSFTPSHKFPKWFLVMGYTRGRVVREEYSKRRHFLAVSFFAEPHIHW